MRRTLAAALVALSTGLAVLPATATSAATTDPGAPVVDTVTPVDDGTVTAATARRTLAQASDVLAGGGAEAVTDAPDTTLLMRDLFEAVPALGGTERERAEALLARPTNGSRDPYGDGYTVGSRKKCSSHFCLHYVTSTADAPPSKAWVKKNLKVLDKVWRTEVGKMGFRPPVKDGNHGGNGKFDVYLKELGAKRLYGYCAPEYRKKGTKWVASGYCVLDNDFAQAQYGAPPAKSLKVTAAHEFFHAVQFAYDYHEDPWLLESTATWMEERVADDINDNRQYLSASQVADPSSSLDVFQPSGFAQYGNWTFWEYLSRRFGNGIVKSVWNKAGAFKGAPNMYSAKALKKAVGGKGGGFASVFAAYAASNTVPARYYPEGSAWPKSPMSKKIRLTKGDRKGSASVRINHLASRSIAVKPGSDLRGKKWRLRVVVNAPNRSSSPAVHVLVRNKKGAWSRKTIALSAKGHGKKVLSFNGAKVAGVTITLANASTRYRCSRGTNLSCRGKAVDQKKSFKVKVKAVKRKR
ncbi:MXAN_6640 family putative metalloprotease [Nocardioides sp. Arc9.136]|uniref:MXAN_6640 family putative metalloprotease n=1 Tax=Nocardioides sp. Arc9.136 TaxID=2996826 RepID=UPI0026658DB5|nr:MXAN_6640 family putative metalloprotease [Nocardioides sp. Arc9.136]WKN47391.1 DUF6055 domain-containing protein [Nocardioides sp. Arc9.136]